MAKRKYSLRYLPLFGKDIAGVKNYIANTLQSPAAAEKLIVETEQAILKRLSTPLSHKPYSSKKDRKHLYYRIHVRNFIVFYVVIDDVMEIRRFLYSRRDINNLI
jgi:plasmid stabilization system protein ParE